MVGTSNLGWTGFTMLPSPLQSIYQPCGLTCFLHKRQGLLIRPVNSARMDSAIFFKMKQQKGTFVANRCSFFHILKSCNRSTKNRILRVYTSAYHIIDAAISCFVPILWAAIRQGGHEHSVFQPFGNQNLPVTRHVWWLQRVPMFIWLVVSTPLKNISQLGWLFPIYGKIQNVPNHRPVILPSAHFACCSCQNVLTAELKAKTDCRVVLGRFMWIQVGIPKNSLFTSSREFPPPQSMSPKESPKATNIYRMPWILINPICSMYGIFTNIYPKITPM